jgi:hypothetical protein
MSEKKNGSGLYIDYNFKYNDKSPEELYTYEVPFADACAGIRKYFDSKNITLDGTDGAIWNACAELEILDNISEDDSFIDYCKEKCKDAAFAEYKDNYEYDNDLGEYAPKNEALEDSNTVHKFTKEELEEMAQEAIFKASQRLDAGYEEDTVQYTHTSGPMQDYGDTGEVDGTVYYTYDFENADVDVTIDDEGATIDITVKALDEDGNEGDNPLYSTIDITWADEPTEKDIINELAAGF